MDEKGSEHVTQLLADVADGRDGAAEKLLALVYGELRALAQRQMAQLSPSDSLSPTALVHEVYVRLLGTASPDWKSRDHFFATAARAMRAIIVDQARWRAACKRGGDRQRVPLNEETLLIVPETDDVLAVDAALSQLQSDHEEVAEVVMLRFFGGLTVDETAAALRLSPATVDRHWLFAKAWLRRALAEPIT